jgi:upstream activation factor subunit UAF30
MPRQSTKASSDVSAPVSESVAQNVESSSTSIPKKMSKKTKSVETPDAALIAAPIAAPISVESNQVSSDVEASAFADAEVETPIIEQSVEFIAKLQQLGVLISSLKSEYRTLEKKWTRELKVAQKLSSKRKRKSGNRAPSGFVKPTRISDELAKFLEKPTGSEMARTAVTREINQYIRTHNLQDKENGRKINPDTKLTALLSLKKTDELTYFNLQRYMSPHFAKSVKEATV